MAHAAASEANAEEEQYLAALHAPLLEFHAPLRAVSSFVPEWSEAMHCASSANGHVTGEPVMCAETVNAGRACQPAEAVE